MLAKNPPIENSEEKKPKPHIPILQLDKVKVPDIPSKLEKQAKNEETKVIPETTFKSYSIVNKAPASSSNPIKKKLLPPAESVIKVQTTGEPFGIKSKLEMTAPMKSTASPDSD